MEVSPYRWLYTSEGLGDVVEWIDEDEVDSAQATFAGEMHFGLGFLGAGFPDAMKDSKGRIGSRAERREKLGQVSIAAPAQVP